MGHTQNIPACYRHMDKDKAPDALFTLAKYTSPKRIPDTDAAGFHSLLCAAGIISPDRPLPQKSDGATCFQIVSEYKCGYLCQMCDYSSRNKNRLETEESLLLAYAMKSWNCFDYLRREGLEPEHFHAIFLLNDRPSGKIVPTLPLFRLSYSYIERMGKPELKFSDLPVMISAALDKNNPGKLLPRNVQAVMRYLQQLHLSCASLTQEKIATSLALVLHPNQDTEHPSVDTPAPATPKEAIENASPADCITGLLAPGTSCMPSTAKTRREPVQKENPEAGCVDTSSVPHTAAETEKQEPFPQPGISTDVSVPMPAEPSPAPDESFFLPEKFSAGESEGTGYPFHCIEDIPADLRRLEHFLLFNPVIGMEAVTDADTGAQMVLLCASNQFCYVPAENEQISDLIRTYFSKSSVRRQVCMDPYRVYHYLQKHSICCHNVYSLRNAYQVLSEAKGKERTKKPSEMTKELVSRENLYSHPPYIFAMLHYVRMYEVLSAHELMNMHRQKERLRTISGIDSLLGISYELGDVTETAGPLFTVDENLEFRFRYGPETKLKEAFCAATFTFSVSKPVKPLVESLLCCISRKKMALLYGFRLLQYSDDSFTLATPAENYGLLCDTVANLSSFLAEKMGLAPLDIREETIKQP